jgi:hypothetical protein
MGEEVHGNGVHMDDYETHDDRRVQGSPSNRRLPTDVRRSDEINMVVGERSAGVPGRASRR